MKKIYRKCFLSLLAMAFGTNLMFATDIVVDVAAGKEIAAEVEAAKAAVDSVDNITINLADSAKYTLAASIEVPAGLVINGNNATIDASACEAPFIALSKTPSAELINNYYRVGQIKIANLTVDSIKNSIIYDNSIQYCVVDLTIENTVLNLATKAVQNEALISFKQGGVKDLNIRNSTVYGNGVAKYFVRYNNNARLDRYGFDKNTEFQTMNYQNNTFYNVIQAGGQWGNYSGIGGQNYSKFDVQKNIWVECGNEIIRRMAGGRFSGKNPMTFAYNTYILNGADNSAKEASYDNSGNILVTNPTFADAAAGNFTIHAGSLQAKMETGDPRWIVAYDSAQAMPLDIVVDVEAGKEIAAAVDSVAATVDKVGNITINLAKGEYTIAGQIMGAGSIIINGDSTVIDASALATAMIVMDTTKFEGFKAVESIKVSNVVVKGLKQALFTSTQKNYNIADFTVDNSVIEVAADVTVFDFTKGSAAMNFNVKNSTLYAPTATGKSVYSSQGGQKATELDADAIQKFSFQNNTIYNIASGKNFFTHRQNSQKWQAYDIQNNIVVNSGKDNFVTSLNGGGDSANPVFTVGTNSVGKLAEGVYTDLSASQKVQNEVVGTMLTTDPGFKDAANGDFTIFAGSDQAKEKIGDARWLVEYDETQGIEENIRVIVEDGAWYTIQGIQVEKPTVKGIYIKNGKKYIVR